MLWYSFLASSRKELPERVGIVMSFNGDDRSGFEGFHSTLLFVELGVFTRQWTRLGLSDDDLRALQAAIMAAPRGGAVVQDAGGMRKLRFAGRASGRGKSGAYRVFYVYFQEHRVILFLVVIAKGEQEDLPVATRHALVREIEHFEDGLRKRGGHGP
jgi:hypothetical protein